MAKPAFMEGQAGKSCRRGVATQGQQGPSLDDKWPWAIADSPVSLLWPHLTVGVPGLGFSNFLIFLKKPEIWNYI